MANTVIRLVTAQTRAILPLENRGAGTYVVNLLIEGNSLLSTVFVESITGSVKVNYHENTTGKDVSERQELPSHTLITAANPSAPSKITVTPFHNSPDLEVIVTGTARFSVYATVVSSFAETPIGGSTETYIGSVGTTSTPVPAVAGAVIEQLSVRCAVDQVPSTRLEFSLDNVNFGVLKVGEAREEEPRDGLRQMYIRAAGLGVISTNYEIFLNLAEP